MFKNSFVLTFTGLAIEVSKEIMIGAQIVAGIVAGIEIRKEAIMIQTGIQEVGIVVGIEAGIGELTLLFSNFALRIQYTLDLRKILGVAKKFLKSRSFLFQTPENP